MNKQQHLNRAKHLFYNGRFNQYVSKDLERFDIIEDGETVKYESITLNPYFDKQTQQVAYGQLDSNRGILKLLLFGKSDYFYDEEATYQWADYKPYGFEDQNED